MRLWQRLFLAFAVLSSLTLAGFVTWQQASFREGFAGYLNAVAQQRLDAASERLADSYRERGNWDFLRGNAAAFEQIIDPFARHRQPREADDGPPPPPPDGDRPPPNDEHPADPYAPGDRSPPHAEQRGFHGGPGGPPNRFDLRSRVLLLDAQGMPVVGNPAARDSTNTARIEVDNVLVGTLKLSPPPPLFGGLDLAFASAQWRDALLAGSIALIGALLFAFAIARWLLAPVRDLTGGMHALTAGDFSQRVVAHGSDELGALARDFNQLAQTLEQHRDARRRWGADIAHELRTPLSILRGEISALQDGVRSATPAAFESLAGECTRLSGLIEDLYQLSLADAGALEYRFERLDLADIVREGVELQQRTCTDTGLALEFSSPDAALPIRGDARRLGQLIDNLLTNARRYTDAPGRIRVALTLSKLEVRLTVDDTPPAVPDAAMPHLFERLYRVDASRNRAAGGAGLGLAICQAIVDAHSGHIQALASPLGGLRIAISFPLGVAEDV